MAHHPVAHINTPHPGHVPNRATIGTPRSSGGRVVGPHGVPAGPGAPAAPGAPPGPATASYIPPNIYDSVFEQRKLALTNQNQDALDALNRQHDRLTYDYGFDTKENPYSQLNMLNQGAEHARLRLVNQQAASGMQYSGAAAAEYGDQLSSADQQRNALKLAYQRALDDNAAGVIAQGHNLQSALGDLASQQFANGAATEPDPSTLSFQGAPAATMQSARPAQAPRPRAPRPTNGAGIIRAGGLPRGLTRR